MKFIKETAYTFEDVTAVPNNPMVERLLKLSRAEDTAQLKGMVFAHKQTDDALQAAKENGEADLSVFRQSNQESYIALLRCIDDLLVRYPQAEPKESRDDIDVCSRSGLGLPIIAANMFTHGKRLIAAMGRYGATGTRMQNQDLKEQYQDLISFRSYMDRQHPHYRDPCVLTPDSTVRDYNYFIQRYEDNIAVVVEGTREHFDRNATFLGIVGPDEIRKAKGYTGTPIRRIYKPADHVTTAYVGIDPRNAVHVMDQSHSHFLPIMDGNTVHGVMSHASAGHHLRYPPHLDENGKIAYLTAFRANASIEFIQQCIEEKIVGVGIVLDRAHQGRGRKPYKKVEKIRELINDLDPGLDFIVGNMANPMDALEAAAAGAKRVKLGIGPGANCTTRVVSGAGVPQFSVIMESREKLNDRAFEHVRIVADGGIDQPGFLGKAINGGADHGMIGGMFTLTRESSPEIVEFGVKRQERIWTGGSASGPVQPILKPRQDETNDQIYRRTNGPRVEGAADHVYLHSEYDCVRDCIKYLLDGDGSNASFAGADNQQEQQEYSILRVQTPAGFKEGKALKK